MIANRGGASGFLQAFIRPEDRGFVFNSRAASPNDRNVFEPLRFRKNQKNFVKNSVKNGLTLPFTGLVFCYRLERHLRQIHQPGILH